MNEFDICVIGGGPSGFAAAMRAGDFGKRVCLIERGPLGGAGIHNGALSSKTFWELSRDYRNAIRTDRGYLAESVQVDFARVLRVVEIATQEKMGQMQRQLDELGSARTGFPGSIRLLRGSARFLSNHSVSVGAEAPDACTTISAGAFILATGSRPTTLPNIPIDGEVILTSDHIGNLRRFPKSMVIVGAGVVGCEFATIFANYAQTKVYIVDRAERILPFEDADIARVCSSNLEAKGVTIHHRAKLISIKRVGSEVEYTIEHPTGGRETLCVEKALISIGRTPNTADLGLENTSVVLDERGYVMHDDYQTHAPNIFAVGDVTLDVALVNVGELEGRHAAERACAAATSPLRPGELSTIMFLDPEVAGIGLNEQAAQAARIPYRVAVYGYALVNRAIAMRDTEGFVKLLVSDDDELKILGMRALGVHASTAIESVSLIMQQKRSARELAELLHPHPAITEALQDCVRMLLGSSIYKPCVFTSKLRLSRINYE